MNQAIRSVVEGWLDRHEVKNLRGAAEGPRTILVMPEDAEELEAAIDRLFPAPPVPDSAPAVITAWDSAYGTASQP